MCSPCLCCLLHPFSSFLQAFEQKRAVLVALLPLSPTSSIPPACFCFQPLCFLDLSSFPSPGQQLLVAGAHEIHVGTPVEQPVCFQDCFASWPGQLYSPLTPRLFPQVSYWFFQHFYYILHSNGVMERGGASKIFFLQELLVFLTATVSAIVVFSLTLGSSLLNLASS